MIQTREVCLPLVHLPVHVLGFGDDGMGSCGGGAQRVICWGLLPVERVRLLDTPSLHASLEQS